MIHSHILQIYIKRNTQNYFMLDILEKKDKEIYLYLSIYKAKHWGKQESKNNNSTTEYISCKECTFTVNQSEVTQPWMLQTMQCFNATSRSPSSAYGLATTNCMPTYVALVCHRQPTAHLRQAQNPRTCSTVLPQFWKETQTQHWPTRSHACRKLWGIKGPKGTCCFTNTLS